MEISETPPKSWPVLARRIRVPMGFVLAAFYLWLARPSALSIMAGSAISMFGLLLRAYASGHVRKNSELAASGPYAVMRHPLYVGSLIMAGGFAMASGRPVLMGAIVALFFLAVYVPVMRAEERYLKERFPEYGEYARRVPPFGFRLRRGKPGATDFSWQLYWRHREYNALIGAVLMILALFGKLDWLHR